MIAIDRNRLKFRQAEAPAAALPLGSYELKRSSSGLWRFEAEGVVYSIKRRQAVSTKPLLYIMAEVKPKPLYVSSLYFYGFRESDCKQAGYVTSLWAYLAQAPEPDSPLRVITCSEWCEYSRPNGAAMAQYILEITEGLSWLVKSAEPEPEGFEVKQAFSSAFF